MSMPRRLPTLLAGCLAVWLCERGSAAELAEAQKLAASGRYEAALAEASAVISQRVYGEDWWLLKAEMELTLGRYADAKSTLEAAIERERWSVRLRSRLREAARFTGDVELAHSQLASITQLVKSSPWRYSDAESLLQLGWISLELGGDARQVQEVFFKRVQRNFPRQSGSWLALGELALEKRDFQLAAETFRDGLKSFSDIADMHYGLARALRSSDPAAADAALQKALTINPRHVPALLLRADWLLDAERYDEAQQSLQQVLEINPLHPRALAFAAAIAHLQNDRQTADDLRNRALSTWSTNPEVDYLIGRELSQKYRFREGAAHQRRALELDDACLPARKQLAEDLLRLGQEEEGWRLADEAFQADGYDVAMFNLVTLRDELEQFRTLEDPPFVVRMEAREADLYGDRVLALLHEAHRVLGEKYGAVPEGPVLVEIFPRPDDFAVRTFGLPGAGGYLGVCFGSVITANSPAAQLQPSNWQAVLWHEFAHVVTLQLTGNKLPRWLSEGISVYEERQRDAAWGERMKPAYRELILQGGLTPIAELSGAFLAPPSGLHLMFAYFESSLVVEHLVDQYGFEALRSVLADLQHGITINDALQRHTAPLDQLQAGFEEFAMQRARDLAPDVDWSQPPSALAASGDAAAWRAWIDAHPGHLAALTAAAQFLLRQEQWDEAKALLKQAVALYPQQRGRDSPALLLAGLHRRLGETDRELDVLRGYAEHDPDAIDVFLRLIELETAAGNWEQVHRQALRALAVNPLIASPHRAMAESAERLGLPEDAIASYTRQLALPPEDAAAVHYRLAVLLREQGETDAARRHVLQALEAAPRFRAGQALLLRLVRESEDPAAD